MKNRPITLLGIGNDGCTTLSNLAFNRILAAHVLVGAERNLAFFPEFSGKKIILGKKLSMLIDTIDELAEDHNICVLASGDPLFFGIGHLLLRRLGRDSISIIPQPSSMQWAFSRIGLNWDDAVFFSVHGRQLEGLANKLRSCHKAGIFTDESNSPSTIAEHLLQYGHKGWQAWLCEDLGGANERVRFVASLQDLAQLSQVNPLNVLILHRDSTEWRAPSCVSYLHEDTFAKRIPKRGLISKREVRLVSIASLELRPSDIVWDIGSGSGSVSIEAAMLARQGHVYAVEVDPTGVAICRDNARLHGTDNLSVIEGRAPEALQSLPDPNAIFIGGTKGDMDSIVHQCWEQLRPGGRLVINAITFENVHSAYQAFRSRDLIPEITLLSVSRGVPLAHYMRYEALNPVHIFAIQKKPSEQSSRAQITSSQQTGLQTKNERIFHGG